MALNKAPFFKPLPASPKPACSAATLYTYLYWVYKLPDINNIFHAADAAEQSSLRGKHCDAAPLRTSREKY